MATGRQASLMKTHHVTGSSEQQANWQSQHDVHCACVLTVMPFQADEEYVEGGGGLSKG